MSNITKQDHNNIPEIVNDVERNVWLALKNTLYPNAKEESIKMVIQYCKAANLDPMQKPVHIVPMSVKNGKDQNGKDKYEYRDVVMPGIGLYRIQAARSHAYAGVSEPEFGEDITEDLGKEKITYPKWCKVTVKRLIEGQIAEFSAKEFWKENYATTGNEGAPNTMWKKRPYGQLAKCAEAQALRKAFPELISSQPTAEEMEGKTLIENDVKDITPSNKTKTLTERLDALLPEEATREQLIYRLVELVNTKKIDEAMDQACERYNIKSIYQMTQDQLKKSIEWAERRQEGE